MAAVDGVAGQADLASLRAARLAAVQEEFEYDDNGCLEMETAFALLRGKPCFAMNAKALVRSTLVHFTSTLPMEQGVREVNKGGQRAFSRLSPRHDPSARVNTEVRWFFSALVFFFSVFFFFLSLSLLSIEASSHEPGRKDSTVRGHSQARCRFQRFGGGASVPHHHRALRCLRQPLGRHGKPSCDAEDLAQGHDACSSLRCL